MREVYGQTDIVLKAKQFFHDYVNMHPKMLHHMLQNTLHHKISLGVFGQLIKERYGEDTGSVDIKYGAYIPIVNGIRLLALEADVRSTSTEERIEQLIAGRHVEEELGHDWLEAASLVIKLRSETPFQVENGHFTTRGKLTAELLTKERVNQLKFCLRIGKDLQKYVLNKIKERGLS
jgi:CBS domain-containing protein